MVCIRCKMVVKSELERLGIKHTFIELGEAEINGEISEGTKSRLDFALRKQGLELMDERRNMLIEKIKTTHDICTESMGLM